MSKGKELEKATENKELANYADQYSGMGLSTAQEDNLVPLLYVLQTNSPQVNKRDAKYVEGAEPGDIWLRNAPEPIIKGEVGVLFQPCYFYKDFGEWIDRDAGGGLVARYPELPPGTKEVQDPERPSIPRYYSPAGNELIETRNFAGYILIDDDAIPYLIPLKGASHSIGKQWMTSMNMKKTSSGRKAPIFGNTYLLKTAHRKNNKGEFFVLDPRDGPPISKLEDLKRGHDLHMAFAAGLKKAEEEDTTVERVDRSGVM